MLFTRMANGGFHAQKAAATSPKIIHLIAMNFQMYFSSYLPGIILLSHMSVCSHLGIW
jgi:hypothetical protein